MVAKSNILVNSPNETKYFYQDLDANGERLNSTNRYAVTFAKDQSPAVYGFWSLSIYNEHHFFVANPIKRFSWARRTRTSSSVPMARSPFMCKPTSLPIPCSAQIGYLPREASPDDACYGTQSTPGRSRGLIAVTRPRKQPSSGYRDRGRHVPSHVPSQTACSRQRAAPHRRCYSS
jgi:Protein of unknown function (DUF1214)